MIGFKRNIREYLILNFLVLVGVVFVFQLWKSNIFKYPLAYGGDATLAMYYYRKVFDSGVFGYPTNVSFPYFNYTDDFLTNGQVSIFIRSLIVRIMGGNIAFSVNFHFLISFFLIANATFYTLKKMKISNVTSGVTAILYSFLPFHFFRGIYHINYSNYWFIPLFVYCCIKYLNLEEEYNFDSKQSFVVNNARHIFLMLYIGGISFYYTYFCCFFLSYVIIVLIIKRQSWKYIRQPLIDIGMIFLMSGITISRLLIEWNIYGKNKVTERWPQEIEQFGLKITQLLLPIDGHRLKVLSNLKKIYNEFPLINENSVVTLGLFFSIGFIVLIVDLVNVNRINKNIHQCAILNIGALLLATIGGVSSIIALFFSKVRCYNRISVFIAFFSAIAFAYFIDFLFEKANKKWLTIFIGGLVLLVGVLDQTTTRFIPQYYTIAEKWNSDENFIKQIENIDGKDAKIYVMPYVPYPEKTRNKTGSYELLIGYIHSDTLVWSAGAIDGREGDKWNTYISQKNITEQVKAIYLNGFKGIFIDKRGYTDEEFENLIDDLNRITNSTYLRSDNKNLYYYSLSNYILTEPSEADYVISKGYFEYGDGFYPLEQDGDDYWNWCSGNGEIKYINNSEERALVNLKMNIVPYVSEGTYTLTLSVGNRAMDYTINAGENNIITFPIDLLPGENVIEFKSDIPAKTIKDDVRKLSFVMRELNIKEAINLESPQIYMFGTKGNSDELTIYGLSAPEDGYTWTDGNYVHILESFDNASTISCKISTAGIISDKQQVDIYVNDSLLESKEVMAGDEADSFEFSFEYTPSTMVDITLYLPDAVSPASIDNNNMDTRKLGLAIQDIEFSSE